MMAVIPVAGNVASLMILPERGHVSLTLATDGAGLRTGVDLPPAQARELAAALVACAEAVEGGAG